MKRIITIFFGLLLSIFSVCAAEEPVIMNDDDHFIAGVRYLREKNFKSAADCFRPLAEKGHGQAQYFYGSLLCSGSGVSKDPERAFDYYTAAEKSADLPDYVRHNLEYCIANMYISGQGIPKDENTALQFFIQSGEGNDEEALIALGQIYLHGHGSIPKDLKQAKYWLEKAGLAGDGKSSFSVGQMYSNGDLEEDTSKAIEWFSRAKSQGSHLATHNLACIYIKAGKYQNKPLAYSLFQQAAQNNIPQSLYMMGVMYVTGEGVLQHDAIAFYYFKCAEALGVSEATTEINKIKERVEAAKERLLSAQDDLKFKEKYLTSVLPLLSTDDQIAAAKKAVAELYNNP